MKRKRSTLSLSLIRTSLLFYFSCIPWTNQQNVRIHNVIKGLPDMSKIVIKSWYYLSNPLTITHHASVLLAHLGILHLLLHSDSSMDVTTPTPQRGIATIVWGSYDHWDDILGWYNPVLWLKHDCLPSLSSDNWYSHFVLT